MTPEQKQYAGKSRLDLIEPGFLALEDTARKGQEQIGHPMLDFAVWPAVELGANKTTTEAYAGAMMRYLQAEDVRGVAMRTVVAYRLGLVLGIGAEKYAPHQWRLGVPFQTLNEAITRHCVRWRCGETCDPESGVHHGYHVLANLMFLWVFQNEGRDSSGKPVSGSVLQDGSVMP